VSLAIIFVFPEKARPRDTKRREDKGELRPRNLLSACYRNAKGLRYFPIYPEEFGKNAETYATDILGLAKRNHLQMQSVVRRRIVFAALYSFEMNSFNDSDASVEAKMMAATANRPTM
jgi:hypothetical protein